MEAVRGARVYGAEGTLVSGTPIRLRTTRDDDHGDAGEWTTVDVDSGGSAGVRLISDFVRAVRAESEPRVNGREATKSLEIVDAAYRSGEEGTPVELPIDR